MRLHRLMCALIWLVVLGFPRSNAAIRYVKADARGTSTGTSWANAYTSLQSALGAAKSGDEIRVAAGTYKPTAGTDRTASFRMKTGVAIYGGFAGNETTRDRNFIAHPTILSGEIGASTKIDNSYHVVTGANGRLDGFTITGGYADRPKEHYGAGMSNIHVAPTIVNCIFSNNTIPTYYYNEENWRDDDSRGAAVYNASSSPVFQCCVFVNNAATGGGDGNRGLGGAIYADTTSTLQATNCVFVQNSVTGAHASGGGSPYISPPQSDAFGGAIYTDCNTVLTNCTFHANTATGGQIDGYWYHGTYFPDSQGRDWGSGFYNNSDFIPRHVTSTLSNCIFTSNTIYRDGTFVIYKNCDLGGYVGSGASWDMDLGTDGGGNIAADAMFVNAANPAGPDGIWMTADDGLRLRAGSPCIDAGTNMEASNVDITGQIHYNNADMGAYENPSRNAARQWGMYR